MWKVHINILHFSTFLHQKSSLLFILLIILVVNPFSLKSQSDSSNALYIKALFLYNKGNYDEAIHLLDSLISISSNRNEDLKLNTYLLAKTEIYAQKRDFQNSLDILNQVQDNIINNKLTKDLIYADYLQIRGNYYLVNNQIDSSLLYIYNSIKARLKIQRKIDSSFSYSYNKLGNIYLTLGNYDSSNLYYKQAIELSLTKKDPNGYEISSYYQNLAIIYTLTGDYLNAEHYFLKSLKIKQIYFEPYDLALAKIYNNLGRFYSSISKFDSSYKYYTKAEDIYLRNFSIDNFNLAPIYWNKGTDLIHKGDYEQAINYLKQAYYIYSINLENDNPTLLLIINDLGLAFERIGNYKEAIAYFKIGLKNINSPSYVKILRNIANTYSLLNDNTNANFYFQESISQAIHFFGMNSYDLALCYSNYGNFLLNTYNDKRGLKYYYDGIKILENIFSRNHRDIAQIHTNISLYYSSSGQYLEALESSQNALKALFTEFNPTNNIQNPIIFNQLPDLFTLSAFYQKSLTLFNLFKSNETDLKYLLASFSTIEICFNIISELRNSYSNEESKLIFVNAASSAYELGVEISYLLSLFDDEIYYSAKAFEFNEKNKSVLLLSSLRDVEALESSGIPTEYRNQEKFLKDKILTLNNLIYNEGKNINLNNEKITYWENEMFQTKFKYDSLLTSLEKDYPSYYNLKYEDSIVTIPQLQLILEHDQVVLEYLTTDSSIFIFVISNSTFDIFKINNTNDFNKCLFEVLNLFKGNGLINLTSEEFQSYTNYSFSLYQYLIDPAARFINGKRLLIIPDAELGYLSFDLLLTRQTSDVIMNFRTLPYLIKEHPITYSSSATLFFDAHTKSKNKADKSLIAFAPKYNDQLNTRSAPNDSLRKTIQQLLPIPGVEAEVSNIIRIFRGKKYADLQATESTFKKYASGYNILHLAMHTIIDDENPMFSKLVFTPGKDEEDGLLNTYELFNLDLKGSLAVLSACNTGTGKLEKGEGIISLARGFIYAGIPSIVMTLWEVEDYSSADLMTGFYEYLKQGLPKDIALQKAKLDYLNQADALKSHPYFWAGFVNIGSPQPVEPPAGKPAWWILPLVVLILLIIFINIRGYFKKRRIKR